MQEAEDGLSEADLSLAMEKLVFVEGATVLLTGEARADTGSKLEHILANVLRPCSSDGTTMVYVGAENPENMRLYGSALLPSPGETAQSGLDDSVGTDTDMDDESSLVSSVSDMVSLESNVGDKPEQAAAHSPVFVRLQVIGGPLMSVGELAHRQQSSSVAVLLSLMKIPGSDEDPSIMPSMHKSVAAELSFLMNGYMAERTLERLRFCGAKIESADVRIAKSCLQKALEVQRRCIDVSFYHIATDQMVSTTAPGITWDEATNLLVADFNENGSVSMKHLGRERFMLFELESSSVALAYWCFVCLRDSRGLSTIDVHHPDPALASETMGRLVGMFLRSCHRVNQRLLLKALHERRVANQLLLPLSTNTGEELVASNSTDSRFAPGSFSCPVVFRTAFPLFHRTAMNPENIARTLEGTVLHIFAVANHSHTFVYKDEDGSVFYMELLAHGGNVEPDGYLELFVHGVSSPSSSVTSQLTSLLKRKLLSLSVDSLAAVLVKNHAYSWRLLDWEFVRSFGAEWAKVEGSDEMEANTLTSSRREYHCPVPIPVLGMVLLYFRQNLCGSTFFYPLVHQADGSDERHSFGDESAFGVSFGDRYLTFYYNNAPSKLDPSIQDQLTLTSKGADYSRGTGAGISVIRIDMKGPHGLDTSTFGEASVCIKGYEVQGVDALSFRETSSDEQQVVSVEVYGTILKTNVLHDWVLLTLNQVLLAWVIELHLRQMHVLESPTEEGDGFGGLASSKGFVHLDRNVLTGFARYIELLELAHNLPHPAVLRFQQTNFLRSADLRDTVRVFVESLPALGTKPQLDSDDLVIIRRSVDGSSTRVKLSRRTPASTDIEVQKYRTGEVILDQPVDSPEYLCFYRSPIDTLRATDHDGPQSIARIPKLFEQVSLDQGAMEGGDPFMQHLVSCRRDEPAAFNRSFSFVFSAQRTRRTLLSYNWSQSLFDQVSSVMQQQEQVSMTKRHDHVGLVLRKSLRFLSSASYPTENKQGDTGSLTSSPGSLRADRRSDKERQSQGDREPKPAAPDPETQTKPPSTRRKIARPVTIRKAILVGKVSRDQCPRRAP